MASAVYRRSLCGELCNTAIQLPFVAANLNVQRAWCRTVFNLSACCARLLSRTRPSQREQLNYCIEGLFCLKANSCDIAENVRACLESCCSSHLLLRPIELAKAQEEPTFRTQSNVVLVPTLVRDKAGEVVYGLQAKDFIVEDDGVAQTVRLDEAAESEPVSLVIAIQCGRRADYELPRMQGSGLDAAAVDGAT